MAVDPLAGERVLAFDTETTGISTTRSRIVQFALVGSDVNGEPVHIEHIVDPRCPIPVEASRVHGIYDGDVRGAPVFRDVADELHEAIEGAVLVGHNVRRFDMGMVEAEFMRLGRLPPRPRPCWTPWKLRAGSRSDVRTTSAHCVNVTAFVSRRPTRLGLTRRPR